MHPSCIFCKIVAGESPSYNIYEDDETLALLNIHPVNRGHVLVIPKAHHADLYETPKDVFAKVMDTVHLIAPKLKRALNADGINVGINTEEAAGQIIFHLHVHVIPRFEGDGHKHWHGNLYQDGDIKTIGDIISQEFK